jgi:hypothetical protein
MMPRKVLQANGFVVEGFPPERIWNLDRLCTPLHVINVPVRAALWAHKQASIRTLSKKAKLPGRDELALFIVAAVHELLELLTVAHVLSDRFILTGIVPCHTRARSLHEPEKLGATNFGTVGGVTKEDGRCNLL